MQYQVNFKKKCAAQTAGSARRTLPTARGINLKTAGRL